MKKKLIRKLRQLANEILGEEETNKIIAETVKEVLEETKPKATKKASKTSKKGEE